MTLYIYKDGQKWDFPAWRQDLDKKIARQAMVCREAGLGLLAVMAIGWVSGGGAGRMVLHLGFIQLYPVLSTFIHLDGLVRWGEGCGVCEHLGV